MYGFLPLVVPIEMPWRQHTAVLEAEGGWEQWPIVGWAVFDRSDSTAGRGVLLVGIIMAAVGSGWLWWLSRRPGSYFRLQPGYWWSRFVAWYGRFGELAHMGVTFAIAIELYLTSAWALLGLPLALSIFLRPDVGLTLIAFGLSFLPTHSPSPILGLSVLEILLVFIVVGVVINPKRPAWHLD